MRFLEVLQRAKSHLREERRISFRALKRQFDLEDDEVDELVEELVDVQQVAAREGKVLAWLGEATPASTQPPSGATTAMDSARQEISSSDSGAGERRQLTVMFCDLVGSTDLSQRLDAEDLRDVIHSYHESATAVVERYDGHVAQYLGDGLLVYFGYPKAHEDDAERAVRTGLEIVSAIGTLNESLESRHRVRLAVRVGIHTGPVVVSEMGSGMKSETLALGDTTNIAARLEGIAESNSVVISGASLRLVPGLFVTNELGSPPLKGIAEPIRLYAVVHATGVRSRLLANPGKLTPLVGRDQEIGLLLERWEEVQESDGQAVFISGEAGLGKSRLLQEFRERLAETPHGWLECRCSPYTQGTAFRPLVELVEQGLGFREGDELETKLARLERGVEVAGLSTPEIVPLVAPLISLPLPESYPQLELSPEFQRRKTIEALVAWILGLAEDQPLVMLVEDLHWCDPSTVEFLGWLLDQCPTAKVLTLLTFRPSFDPPWAVRSHVTTVAVKRLSNRQGKNMVGGMTPGVPLPVEVVERIVERADGVPIFLEEVTKMVLESDIVEVVGGCYQLTGPLTELQIPTTLQDSLMARLDRLDQGKKVAQLGAALGREFFYELLCSVSLEDEPRIRAGLAQLVDAELVYQRGALPKADFTFKHSMIQDTAYQSLLRGARQQFHERIAKVLEERFPERVEAEPEVLARHYEGAGITVKAIGSYQRAGMQAAERSANSEAIGHLRKAISLLEAHPEGRARDEWEASLQVSLAAPLVALKGFGGDDVEETFDRARALCERLGDTPQLADALGGLVSFYTTQSRLGHAAQLSEQQLRVAERLHEPGQIMYAHYSAALIQYFLGEPDKALRHFHRVNEVDDTITDRTLVSIRGEVLGVVSRVWFAWALWVRGLPGRSLEASREAIALAREAEHPFSLAYALAWGSVVHYMRRERELALECAEEAVEIAEGQGFPIPLGVARLVQIWADTSKGQADAAIDQALARSQGALAELGNTGTQAAIPQILAGLADTCLEVGRPQVATGYIEIALATSARTGQPFWDSDLYRLKGVCLLQVVGDEEKAEELLRKAVEIAASQQAESLHLRAATSLARLLVNRGDGDDAHALLAPIYGRFTEGFDTQDLKDAKALLGELP